jgi:CheY-like chemotaxis protein
VIKHFFVQQAADGPAALAALEEHRAVAVISDQLMLGATGVEVLARARARPPDAVRILNDLER